MKIPEAFRNTRFLFILFSAFLAILGFGLIIPIIPFIVGQYTTDQNEIAFYVGLLISVYSFCQFFAAPVLGALSDKYGRRPVLLFCLLGSALGYILFGIGGSLAVLLIGRIIDGLTGGDISTIFAYLADITKPQERGKYFGIVGATVGFGFIIGPTIGGLLANYGLSAPVYVAAFLTILNMLFGYFVLPESLSKSNRMSDFSLHHLNPFTQLEFVMNKKLLKHLIIIGLFYSFPFAILQGISSVFLKDIIHWTPSDLGFYFLILGLGDMFTQGFLNGKLMPKFGPLNLVLAGFFLTGIAFVINAILPLSPLVVLAYVYIVIYALGSGLFEPAYGNLVSQSAEPQEQGRVQGASQSAQSITRIIGPLAAAYLYQFSPSVPWIVAVVLSGCGIGFLMYYKKEIQSHIKFSHTS